MNRLVIRFSLMVMVLLISINTVFTPVLEKYALKLIGRQMDRYHENLFKGPYFFMMKYFERIPEDRIPAEIQGLQKELGTTPMAAVDIYADGFSPLERSRLEAGEILTREEGRKLFYKRVNQTRWAIRIGPFGSIEQFFDLWHYNLLIWGSLGLLVMLISLVAVIPFWRRLTVLMTAARRFGEGDLAARAEVPRCSSLHSMAETFNAMAGRIGSLIQSQKLLINAVSHDLRTPIARIRFGMEMLETAGDTPKRDEYAASVLEDVDDLEALVTALLTYTAFDDKPLDLQSIDTRAWFDSLMSKMTPMNPGKRLSLDVSRAPDRFAADPKLLARALENLILNGFRHTRTFVRIRAEALDTTLNLTVTDDGPGIPDSDRKRIFDPFVRLDESRNPDSGGYGLGLAIVKQIVSAHKGRVRVRNNPAGQGACFTITLPLNPNISYP